MNDNNVVPFARNLPPQDEILIRMPSCESCENMVIMSKMPDGEYWFGALDWERRSVLDLIKALLQELEDA